MSVYLSDAERVAMMTTDLEELRQALQAAQEEITRLRTVIERMKLQKSYGAYEMVSAHANAMEAERDTVLAELAKLRVTLSTEIKGADESINALGRELSAEKQKREEAEHVADERRRHVETLTKQLRNLRESSKAAHEATKRDYADLAMRTMRAVEVANRWAKAWKTKATRSQYDGNAIQLDDIRRERDALQVAVAKWSGEASGHRMRAERLTEELGLLKRAHVKLQEECERILPKAEAAIDRLKKETAELKERLAEEIRRNGVRLATRAKKLHEEKKKRMAAEDKVAILRAALQRFPLNPFTVKALRERPELLKHEPGSVWAFTYADYLAIADALEDV